MRLVEPPRRVLASEFREEMAEGESRPLLINAFADDWSERFEIVLKLRDPQVPEERHGGTGLACELICAMLARTFGFPMPDYFIVVISEDFADAMDNDETRRRVAANIGLNYGTAYLKAARTWRTSRRRLGEELTQFFFDLLDFDSAILNGDRDLEEPNLLWNGKACFPIDHALTFDPCRRDSESYERFLADPTLGDEVIKTHIRRQLLYWRKRPDSRFISR